MGKVLSMNPNVPIIGSPQAHALLISAVATCPCGTGRPMLLLNTGPNACTGCGKQYIIAECRYEHGADGTPTLQIGIAQVIVRTPVDIQ